MGVKKVNETECAEEGNHARVVNRGESFNRCYSAKYVVEQVGNEDESQTSPQISYMSVLATVNRGFVNRYRKMKRVHFSVFPHYPS